MVKWALRDNINKNTSPTLYIKLYLCVKHIVDKIHIQLMNDINGWRETKNGTEIIFIMLSRINFIDYIFISSLSHSPFFHEIINLEFEGSIFSNMKIKKKQKFGKEKASLI